ncbi:tRNA (guanosine(46)-N7)-methyltransferase TrmB [Pseudahrensia aquimaris]|uniref:tRNA (guanine-N(7)-)-methyltransferase n=1 Tax=Pseudahrensia aquimaris TaxID=744461 RepID=A0ABW3FMP8_9HYPH
MNDHPKSRATEAFFGRRKGKALLGRKLRLIEETLPDLLLDPTGPRPQNIKDLFGEPKTAYCMEIGFGGGEHLAKQADSQPDIGFIGIEPFINGMAKMLGEIEDRNLKNVCLFDDDATQVLDWLPENSLDRIDLLYPDPWPKKRNWKRRFVNVKNLDRFARVLKPSGLFRFASDIDTYVNWTLTHIERQGDFRWLAQTAYDWREPWDGWSRTRYEAKAIREGRPPAYLQFRLET